MAPLKNRAAMLTGLVLFHVIFHILHAAPTSHARVAKDTDQNSALQTKLGRIQELIAQLDAEGETSDQTKMDDILPPHPTKVAAQEKQMRSFGREDREKFRKTAAELTIHNGHKESGSPRVSQHASSSRDSLEILAQALARLHQLQAQAEGEGTFGEKMGTKYNEPGKSQQPSMEQNEQSEGGRQLQQTIALALAKLQEDDQPDSQEVELPHSPIFKKFHKEAIRMIEERLLKDLAVADKLGISVDDLVQDFDEQEAREETLQNLENSLASIIGEKDD